MTSIPMSAKKPAHIPAQNLPLPVQIISTVLFGAFGILAVIFAFNYSLFGGIVVAAIIGWRGGFAPGAWGPPPQMPQLDNIMPLAPEAQQRSSGNASFDAYRSETLRRLEEEQENFENFLGRLRAAKDKSEFDDFLDRRAARVRRATADTDVIDDATD
ncbi:DUF2852 domain-containing protein [Cognatiyoonia sp. IB215182]|uniref:DUF2852 domain-containing protein n=1 Tax=Cognatiyoonia sp. IB215182 TaxID=3097353 RepID=UPI002A154FA0|nr:DUF2852 domain-containing protein [Cognatiyoonia sp. IB215182]MDX8352170.1 DUF2852 domain-containing protein [Cognatiyoonia sp. IB215182]